MEKLIRVYLPWLFFLCVAVVIVLLGIVPGLWYLWAAGSMYR